MTNKNRYCIYYQATLDRATTWFVTGCLRGEEYLAFDRAMDKKTNLFEFFVPHEAHDHFLALFKELARLGHVVNLERKPNRLELNGNIF